MQLTLNGRRWSGTVPPRANGRAVTYDYACLFRDDLLKRFERGEWDPWAHEKQDNSPLTIYRYARDWGAKLTHKSADDDRSLIDRYVRGSEFGALELADVRPKHVAEWLDSLRGKTSARGGNLAPRTILGVYSVMRRAFARAVIDELLADSPCALIATAGALPRKSDKVAGQRETWRYTRREAWLLTTSELIPFDRRVLYAVLFYTGARIGEAHALRWSDLDTTTRPLARLTIARSIDARTQDVQTTKTGATKLVPVHNDLLLMLARWQVALKHPLPSTPLVPNKRGLPRTYCSTRSMLTRDLARLGIPLRGQLVHGMRRTFISLCRSDGARGDILRWATHTPVLGSIDGYTSPEWKTLCQAISCLNLDNAPDNAPDISDDDE